MLDELGQGTEGKHAAAIGASILSKLDAKGCRGFFSTHLHDILSLDLGLTNTVGANRRGPAARV